MPEASIEMELAGEWIELAGSNVGVTEARRDLERAGWQVVD